MKTLAGLAGADVSWELSVATAVPFERDEILVNGDIVWSGDGLKQPNGLTNEWSRREMSRSLLELRGGSIHSLRDLRDGLDEAELLIARA